MNIDVNIILEFMEFEWRYVGYIKLWLIYKNCVIKTDIYSYEDI